MDGIREKYGQFGEDVLGKLKSEAHAIIAEMVEPVRVLKNFEGVEILTLDEACAVLRCDRQKLRDACGRDEVPHQRIGRDLIFPKRTLALYLCGEWVKPEKEKASGKVDSGFGGKVHSFVN